MTTRMVEVEGVRELAPQPLDKVVVGEVVRVLPHPNADKLRVGETNIGKETVRIVCGGVNLQEGMRVAVALPGAKVRWHGEGNLVELNETEIRGEKSFGMICAAAELGLESFFPADDHHILDITCDTKARAGTPLADALDLIDSIFDIDNKSLTHRPDLWGHYGMARDLAAVAHAKFIERDFTKGVFTKVPKEKLSVNVTDSLDCPRYTAVRMEGIHIAPSPYWLRKRLVAGGVRPINNMVDITNYVLLELGQPMHAFDAARVREIGVRRAKIGETLTTLDEAERTLDDMMLVITDGVQPIALAGIMGGGSSGITGATTSIIFESANFDAVTVRTTSMRLGLRSESSARFEKGLDPELAPQGLARAVALALQLLPDAKITSAVSDIHSKKRKLATITLPHVLVEQKLGTTLKPRDIKGVLARFGFLVEEKKKGVFTVVAPHWRAGRDITLPEDVIEEIGRGLGYGMLKPTLPLQRMSVRHYNPQLRLQHTIRKSATELGMTEVLNYGFSGGDDLLLVGMPRKSALHLANPISEDATTLRTSLLPGLLRNVATNERQFPRGRIFEIGRVFFNATGEDAAHPDAKTKLPSQPTMCAGAVWKDEGIAWNETAELVRRLLTTLGYAPKFRASEKLYPLVHPCRGAEILVGDARVGLVGEVHPKYSRRMFAKSKVGIWGFALDGLVAAIRQKIAFTPLPHYPAAMRDIAFVVDTEMVYTTLASVVRTSSTLLAQLELFDVFAGQEIGQGKKSMAFHLIFRASDRTLTDKEVEKEMRQIRSALERDCGALLRA